MKCFIPLIPGFTIAFIKELHAFNSYNSYNYIECCLTSTNQAIT